jgi:uncharacterized RDD family membrane protein YckC
MTCPKCAAQIPDDAKSCVMCGAVINPQPLVAPVAPIPPAQPASSVQIDSNKHAAIQWLRLVNYFIDSIAGVAFGAVINFLILPKTDQIVNSSGELILEPWKMVVILMIGFLYPVIYYTFFEAIWQRTPGKWASGTKVVMLDGSKPSFWRIVGRSFARYIPFEVFSYLFGKYPYGWHDALTKTTVVSATYTADDVRSINVHDKGRGSVWIWVLAVIAILLPIVLVFGVLSSVVLVSLNSARMKGNDGMIKSSLAGSKSASEYYYDKAGSYTGFCADEDMSSLKELFTSRSTSLECNDSAGAWAAAAKLSDKTTFCVDSTGYDGAHIGALGSDVSCGKELASGEVNWFTYKAPIDGFSVSLPQEPLVSIENDVSLGFGDATMDQSFYEAQDETNYYSVAKIEYSISLADSEPTEILESMVDAVISSNVTNKLISAEHITYMGDPAIEFVAAVEGAIFSGRYIVADEHTIYSLLYGYGESAYDEATYKKFVDSFRK